MQLHECMNCMKLTIMYQLIFHTKKKKKMKEVDDQGNVKLLRDS